MNRPTIYADELRHESEPPVERRRLTVTPKGIIIGCACLPAKPQLTRDGEYLQAALLDPSTRRPAGAAQLAWRRLVNLF